MPQLTKGSFIIGRDGNYRIDIEVEKILNPYEHFSKIDKQELYNTGVNYFKTEKEEYKSYTFNYKNLSWIIINKR